MVFLGKLANLAGTGEHVIATSERCDWPALEGHLARVGGDALVEAVRAPGVKLAINGKFVNSIRNSSVRKGYLCLESEGSEIHFRNIRILELPPGITTPEQTAKVIE